MKRWARIVIPVVALALLTVPFLVFWRAGWVHVGLNHGQVGQRHGLLHDTTSIYVWTVLAVVYLGWTVGLLVCVVWAFDRFGYHYQPYDRPARQTRRERRRRQAGMAHLRAQERQQAELAGLRRAARESRSAAHEGDGGGAAGPAPGAGPNGAAPAGPVQGSATNGAADHDDEE